MSNVVSKCTCVRDASISYVNMNSRHLVTRVHEHLNSTNSKIAYAHHINPCSCYICNKLDFGPVKSLYSAIVTN